jgi:multidrug resistance efflux pump
VLSELDTEFSVALAILHNERAQHRATKCNDDSLLVREQDVDRRNELAQEHVCSKQRSDNVARPLGRTEVQIPARLDLVDRRSRGEGHERVQLVNKLFGHVLTQRAGDARYHCSKQ